MKILKAKIVSAEVGADGRATVGIELIEKGFKWRKTYDFYTTQTIKMADLKTKIKEDLKKDLSVIGGQLKEIQPEIGKEFTINI